MTNSSAASPRRWGLTICLLSLAMALWVLQRQLPLADLPVALWQPDLSDLAQLKVHYSWLPRFCVALLCGAALGLAGLLMQQVLRNPLASPTTLGVASGAQLALALATLYAPGLLIAGEWVALAGGGLATLLVFALARRRGLSPLSLILAGLVISLLLGALNVMLMLLQPMGLSAMFIWSAGSLSQNNWDAVLFLLPRLGLALVLITLLVRPLSLLELDDSGARSLGLSLDRLRVVALALAVFMTACVVSSVGVIGFIGLAAPTIARLMGARTLRQRLVWTPLLGAALLLLTDQLVQGFAGRLSELLPTGGVTALLGAPLLLWLIPRLRLSTARPQASAQRTRSLPLGGQRLLPLLLLGLLLLAVVALLLGQGPKGWSWSLNPELLQWRLPRLFAALGAGLLLGLAGCLLQRLTGNPMASPELMGISAGAALGLMLTLFVWIGAPFWVRLIMGFAGALLVLLVIVGFARRQAYAPERLLLVGIAISALFDAVKMLVLSLNDPRGQSVL
ncbi:MAG: Fe(3+)-hydroxamate ABC transporter permease FhuB, partial [Pseudomonas neustonica]